jgi:hypothetical protein
MESAPLVKEQSVFQLARLEFDTLYNALALAVRKKH